MFDLLGRGVHHKTNPAKDAKASTTEIRKTKVPAWSTAHILCRHGEQLPFDLG